MNHHIEYFIAISFPGNNLLGKIQMLKVIELSSWQEFEKIVEEDTAYTTKELRTGPSFYRGLPKRRLAIGNNTRKVFGSRH